MQTVFPLLLHGAARGGWFRLPGRRTGRVAYGNILEALPDRRHERRLCGGRREQGRQTRHHCRRALVRRSEFIPRPVRHIPPVLDLPAYLNNELLQNTGDHPFDVDGDGWVDVISVGWTDKEICWYQNPGGVYDEHPWKRHVLGAIAGENEAIALHDFDGDGRPEIYVSAWNKKKPQVIHRFTKDVHGQPALQPVVIGPQGGHGYAFGDVNGDGREDIQCESGWYERPLGDVFQQPWKFHPETALPHPSIPCVLAKLTDSGRTDRFGARRDYGLYWWEQGPPKPTNDHLTEHLIDKSWSQPHGLTWATSMETVNPSDHRQAGACACRQGSRQRSPNASTTTIGTKPPEFTRHDFRSRPGLGMGMQICVADLNADGRGHRRGRQTGTCTAEPVNCSPLRGARGSRKRL